LDSQTQPHKEQEQGHKISSSAKFSKILVAVDGSEESFKAAQYANSNNISLRTESHKMESTFNSKHMQLLEIISKILQIKINFAEDHR
jgi:hypothetical protein